MRYFGGKQRISKPLAEYLNSQLEPNQPFVDLFCGSCNVISKIDPNRLRIANDKHPYLIAMWKALQSGWIPPDHISEDDYKRIKQDTSDPALHGFVGFGLSFGGKWWGGFTGEISKNGQDYLKCAVNGVNRKLLGLADVEFYNEDYQNLVLPRGSLVYCDIPYKNTTPYNKKLLGVFDHNLFYDWCHTQAKSGHRVFVSEYEQNVPKDAVIVWSKDSGTTNAAWMGSAKKTTEVLFTFP